MSRADRAPPSTRAKRESSWTRAGSAKDDRPPRILVVDRDLVTCRAVSSLVSAERDVVVVGHATSFAGALDGIHEHGCDLVLVGLDASFGAHAAELRRLCREGAPAKVVVSGVEPAPGVALRYAEAGVAGVVEGDASATRLRNVVRAAAAGRAEVSPRLAFLLMQRVAELHGLCEERGLDPERLRRLTPREREVLRLLGRGLTNAAIGRELSIRVSTVKSHVHRILRKLDVSRREEAARYLVVARGLPPERSAPASRTARDRHADERAPRERVLPA